MPSARHSYANFSEMPESLQDFLFSDAFTDADVTLQKTYGLSDAQKTFVASKVMDAVFGGVSLSQALTDVRATVVPSPIHEEQWNAFLADLVKLELWPLRELFGDELTTILNQNSLNAVGWPPLRVRLKPLTYGGAASDVAATAGFSIAGPLRERVRDLVISKLKGVRIDAQVKEALMRQSDFGGVGLDATMADKAIEAMNALIGSVQILSEDEYANWLAEETRKKSTADTQPSSVSEEEKEIAAIQAKLPTVSAQAAPSILDHALESIYGGISDRPLDTYLANRLRHVISSRLRDVRSELELRMLLQRDPKVGGLGMTHEAAERMADHIEAGYRTFHDRILEEEKSRLDQQLEEQKKKIEERRAREAEEHAQWYREKVLARKQAEEKKGTFTEQLKRVMTPAPATSAVASPAMDRQEKRAETARFGELVPAATHASPTPQEPSPFGNMNIQPVPATRPEVKVSKATAELSAVAATQKPRLDDVKISAPRLTGPVQELKTLSISEFRRLAKDPEIAAQKILQKFTVLGQESFERRVEGIKAFQQSDLQRAYMTLVAEAFQTGKPVIQLANEKRAQGKDVPSPDELSAIISLNSALHF